MRFAILKDCKKTANTHGEIARVNASYLKENEGVWLDGSVMEEELGAADERVTLAESKPVADQPIGDDTYRK